MSIIRSPKPESNFYLLDKRLSEDKKLSWASRGLLIFLLGKPDNWRISAEYLAQQTNESSKKTGKQGVYSLLDELIVAGYVVRSDKQAHDEKTGFLLGYDYVVYDSPCRPEPYKAEPYKAEPYKAEPYKAEPYKANQPLTSIDSNQGLNLTSIDSNQGLNDCRDVAIADTATGISTKVEPTKKPKLTPEETEANKATWTAYATAYKNRYGVEPLRNAQVNGIISKFVKAVSQEDAPSIARFFINISNQYYVLKLHDIKIMLADAGAIRTQWLTNRTVTTSQARQADTMQTAKSSVDGVLERRAKRQAEAHAMGDIINGECTHV